MRRFVIPDIHACSATLRTLVESIGLNKNDQLYFIGDYIDRGKDSAGVLDFIIGLKDNGYKVFPIRGNHEQNLLETSIEYEPEMFTAFVKMSKSANLLDDSHRVKPLYMNFIESLPFYLELDDFWIVHAGFNTRRNNFLSDTVAMIDCRRFDYSESLLKGKKVVHGHDVTYLKAIESAIEANSKVIPLDNGCVYNRPHKLYDHSQTGQLLCLNLDSMELIKQVNVD